VADPVIAPGLVSTITWTFDDPLGYELAAQDPGSGAFVVGSGILTLAEHTPQATLLGTNPTQNAAAWAVNENDTDGADGLQTVGGEIVDSISAWDITQVDNVAQKMRGRAVTTEIDANHTMRTSDPTQWQVNVWRMYANASGTPGSRRGWIGLWTNGTTPQMGILWDPSDGTFPNTFIIASDGVAGWPSFATEENSGISRTTDAWVFVLWAGREYTLGATTYYDRVIVMNGTVVKKEIQTTTVRTPPYGPRFGCIMDGDFQATPAYFDSYKVWEGALRRYPSVVAVQFPDARPDSISLVSGYSVNSTTTGVDRGGAILTQYQVSSDAGQTFGPLNDISLITSEIFGARGDDVIRIVQYLFSSSSNPNTGVFGLFAPVVNQVTIDYLPAWREQTAEATTWTEAI
jgi:hypothetical protein